LKVGENGGYLRRCSRTVVSVGQMFVVRSAARWDSGPYHSRHYGMSEVNLTQI
jgi:hypothetical protein